MYHDSKLFLFFKKNLRNTVHKRKFSQPPQSVRKRFCLYGSAQNILTISWHWTFKKLKQRFRFNETKWQLSKSYKKIFNQRIGSKVFPTIEEGIRTLQKYFLFSYKKKFSPLKQTMNVSQIFFFSSFVPLKRGKIKSFL